MRQFTDSRHNNRYATLNQSNPAAATMHNSIAASRTKSAKSGKIDLNQSAYIFSNKDDEVRLSNDVQRAS